MRRVAVGGGAFKGENDLANQADDVLKVFIKTSLI